MFSGFRGQRHPDDLAPLAARICPALARNVQGSLVHRPASVPRSVQLAPHGPRPRANAQQALGAKRPSGKGASHTRRAPRALRRPGLRPDFRPGLRVHRRALHQRHVLPNELPGRRHLALPSLRPLKIGQIRVLRKILPHDLTSLDLSGVSVPLASGAKTRTNRAKKDATREMTKLPST